jgi:starch synthase
MVEALVELLPNNRFQFVLLGSGDEALEEKLKQLQEAFPEQVGVKIGYDQSLSHKIEAGADFFLMPSRFEPCGLNQLYSLRYGTIPIVHAVGGLKDTITDISHTKGNGIRYDGFNVPELTNAIQRALKMYCDYHGMERARERGMCQDFSWPTAADHYLKIYRA